MGNYTPNSFMTQPTHLPPLNIPKFSSPPNPNKPTKMQSSLKSGAFSQKQSKEKKNKKEIEIEIGRDQVDRQYFIGLNQPNSNLF